MRLLDTNVVIGVINGRAPALRARFVAALAGEAPVALPAVALFELRCGVARSGRREASARALDAFLEALAGVEPFEAEDAAEAGEVRAALETAGAPIGPYDVLIAAQARRRGAVLVTANTREFARVPGLRLEDWSS